MFLFMIFGTCKVLIVGIEINLNLFFRRVPTVCDVDRGVRSRAAQDQVVLRLWLRRAAHHSGGLEPGGPPQLRHRQVLLAEGGQFFHPQFCGTSYPSDSCKSLQIRLLTDD
jgi:hypothetical protein